MDELLNEMTEKEAGEHIAHLALILPGMDMEVVEKAFKAAYAANPYPTLLPAGLDRLRKVTQVDVL